MRIGIISDLHFDHWFGRYGNQTNVFLDRLIADANGLELDVLVNAGDNSTAGLDDIYGVNFAFKEGLKCPYLFAPGNHDYYQTSKGFQNFINVKQIGDMKFVLATMWSDCWDDPIAEMQFKQTLNDVRYIRWWHMDTMKLFHKEAKAFILANDPDVVVTHNPPSMLSVTERFKDNHYGNMCFIPNMGDAVADSKIKLWIHGHVHSDHDYDLNGTRVVANPLAYPGEMYHYFMDYSIKVVEVTK